MSIVFFLAIASLKLLVIDFDLYRAVLFYQHCCQVIFLSFLIEKFRQLLSISHHRKSNIGTLQSFSFFARKQYLDSRSCHNVGSKTKGNALKHTANKISNNISDVPVHRSVRQFFAACFRVYGCFDHFGANV